MGHMREWSIREAKDRLSELVEAAGREPQAITNRGPPAVVVVAQGEFDRLVRRKEPLTEFFARSGLADVEIERIAAQPRAGGES
jgi:prevent-host-death family protein